MVVALSDIVESYQCWCKRGGQVGSGSGVAVGSARAGRAG